MECFAAQRFTRLLLLSKQQSECMRSQICRRYATTTSSPSTTTSTASEYVRDKDRDNTKFTASEGHMANRTTYQASFASFVCSTLTPTIATTTTAAVAATAAALTDRPVYPYFMCCIKHTVNQPPLTRHFRFYCTAKTTRKKMVKNLLRLNTKKS